MRRWIGLVVVMLMCAGVAQAQRVDGYFLAADGYGVMQVWELIEGDARPVTQAIADVRGFAVSADEQLIAYSSGGQLWLQRRDGASGPLANLSGDVPADPAFSANNQQIVYVDEGIWLAWVSGGAPQQLSADLTMRAPRFVPGTRSLLVQQGPSVALLDLDTGQVQTAPQPGYDRALVLSDGRLVLYSPTVPGVYITTSGDLLMLNQLIVGGPTVRHMVEVPGGAIRMVTWEPIQGQAVVDFNLNSGIATTVSHENLAFVGAPRLSPDGNYVAGYNNVAPDAEAIASGQLVIYEVSTGLVQTLEYPVPAMQYVWAR